MEKEENYSVLFQVHLFFTFFLFLLLPCIANHFEPNLSESVLLALVVLNGLVGCMLCICEGRILMPFKHSLLIFYGLCFYIIGHYFIFDNSDEGRIFVNGIVILMLFTFNLSQACRTKKIALLMLSGIIINGSLQIIMGINQHFISLPALIEEARKNPQIISEYSFAGSDARFLERVNAKLSFGSFIYPNALGAYLGLFLFAITSLYFVNKERFLSQYLNYIIPLLSGLAFVCIFFTGAKGVWFSLILIIVLAFIIFFVYKKNNKLSVRFYFVLLGSLSVFFLSAPILFKNMLSMKVRLGYWRAGWDMFLNESSQFFGLGAGGFTSHFTKYKLPSGEEVQKAHNFFVTLLVEQGVVGLILFLLFLGFIFYHFISKDSALEEKDNIDDNPMPKRVYLLLFFVVFAIFMLINPAISKITVGLSVLTLYILISLFLILVFRFFTFKNVISPLAIERNLSFQMLFLSSCLVVCFTDIIPAYSKLDGLANYLELNDIFPAIFILFLISICFIMILKRKSNASAQKNKINVTPKVLGVLLTLYFLVMIGGDMVGHYTPFVVTFMALLFIIEKNSVDSKNEITINNRVLVYLFAIFCFSFIVFLAEKVVLVDLNSARYHYFFEHAKSLEVEIKEEILVNGQKKFPNQIYFPLEKAKLYSAIGQKYYNGGLIRNASEWYEKAINELDECIKIAPLKANLYDLKADLMEIIQENILEIEKNRMMALSNYPSKAFYHYKLASFYRKIGKVDKALQYFKSADNLQKTSNRYTLLNKEEYEDTTSYIIEKNK